MQLDVYVHGNKLLYIIGYRFRWNIVLIFHKDISAVINKPPHISLSILM
jgi:hypothetical protein